MHEIETLVHTEPLSRLYVKVFSFIDINYPAKLLTCIKRLPALACFLADYFITEKHPRKTDGRLFWHTFFLWNNPQRHFFMLLQTSGIGATAYAVCFFRLKYAVNYTIF